MRKIIVKNDAAFFDSGDDYMDNLRTEIWWESDNDEQYIHIDVEIPEIGDLDLIFSFDQWRRIFGECGEIWTMPSESE